MCIRDSFYTDADGYLKTPEKLPLGRYRVVEIEGPEGFFLSLIHI